MQDDDPSTTAVLAALHWLGALLKDRDMAMLAEFSSDQDVRLIGSEIWEVCRGPDEIRRFLETLFALPDRYGWDWDRCSVSRSGDIAWLFAEGSSVRFAEDGESRKPYRLSGVLERHGRIWLWRQFHGAEPV